MPAIAIYTRVSKDPNEQQTSTPRQERLCRSYADARGWRVVDVFEDVDISAYSGVARPSFEALRATVELGRYDGVLFWKLDRLVRRPSDFERFWAVCEYRGVFLASVTEPVDSSSELGVAVVRLLVTFAGLESSTKSVRLKARARELAEAGRPHTCRRSFGWAHGYKSLEPSEAALIQEAAGLVLAGRSLRSIAIDFNRRGVPVPRTSPWSAGTLRSILRKPALTGDRYHLGDLAASDCWPAILDRETFARVQLVLADRSRPKNGVRSHRPLTGLLYCARCGARMTGNKDRGHKTYACPRPPYGCSGTAIAAESLERWLLWECERRDAPPRPAAGEILAAAKALRSLARDYYVDRVVSRDEFLAARSELAMHEPPVYLDTPDDGDDTALNLYVANRIARIIVHAGRVAKRFDPERLEIAWRSDPVRPLVRAARPDRTSTQHDRDQWLTTEEARHVLGDMNKEYFRELMSSGRLTAWRATGARFRRSDVEALLSTYRYRPKEVSPG